MTTKQVLLSVVAGVAAGATIGVLFAPDKGTETRKKIAQKSREYSDTVTGKFNGLVESIRHPFESAKADVVELSENTTERAQQAAAPNRKARTS